MILNLNLIVEGTIKNTLQLDTRNLTIRREEVRSYNGYIKHRYEVDITNEIKDFCWDFSSRIISREDQYDRLHPTWTNDTQLQELIRVQRSYVGKIGEVAFLILLANNDINVVTDDMFKIYAGQRNTDEHDFETKQGESIDIKTGFREIHKNLVVNLQQLNNIPKDFYVGIKLNAKENNTLNNKIIDDKSITKAKIYGYAERGYLNRRDTVNLGEGQCKAILLENLMDIDKLLNRF